MLMFIGFWVSCSILSFLAHSILKYYENKEYTLRDVVMGLLVSIIGPFYLLFSLMAILGLFLLGFGAMLETFLRDEAMYADKILISSHPKIIEKIKKIFRRKK